MVVGGKMRQRFTYDCVLIKEDDGYCASFPQLPGAFADGDTREEAIAHATEALMAFLADDLNNGLTGRLRTLGRGRGPFSRNRPRGRSGSGVPNI